MKSLMIILAFLLSSISVESCGSSDDAVKAVIDEFVQAMYKPVNFKKMQELYTGFPFSSVARADAHEIKSLTDESGAIIADVHSYWTKSDGTRIDNDFQLKLEKEGDSWKIVNSKGLSRANQAEPSAYDYGLKNGLIKDPDNMWDIELHQAVKLAKSEMKKQ